MVPLLLVLLLPVALANQVCLSISHSNIIVNGMNAIISDNNPESVSCMLNGWPCYVNCTVKNNTWSNGSYVCTDAIVKEIGKNPKYEFDLNEYCFLFLCKPDFILPLIGVLDSNNSQEKEMMQLLYMRDLCVELFNGNRDVKKAFLKTEKKVIHNIMGKTKLQGEAPVKYPLGSLSLNVINSSAQLSSAECKDRIQLEAPQLRPENESFVPKIFLPVDILQTIPNQTIGVVSYMGHNQFQFEEEIISSMIIRIETLGKDRLQNLNTSIGMVFNVSTPQDMHNDSRLTCCYFNETATQWKTDGCKTSNITNNNQTEIICECNHATAFAVLLIRDPISEAHWKILSYISYIGCGMSAFFTALAIVIYVFSRNHKLDYSISIHVSLSGALFLLNTTFLLTEWVPNIKPEWVCTFVAAFMHYSLLCSFTWMAIEALHLYLVLIKVFNAYYKHYMVKLSLVGWGIPGIIVTVSLAMKDFKQFYGVKHLDMAGTNQTTAICWITDDSYFYSVNLVYFTLIFIFNSGILVAVTSRICKMKLMFRRNMKPSEGKNGKDSARFTESCKSSLTVLGLTCLVGSTWGLAFLGSGHTNYPILYLFCILNSLQGFFIFLWICLSTRKQRRREMDERMSSTPVRSSAGKTD
ncbi:adhesion G-protein coupled receptor G5-like [Scomber scombrus]|uniref:Adhesion G-protein coupled receptor G5-like n=1 Tax=Scomber scombrus TaxID=13677 RepID=A0AAV1NRD1_SCOSC